MPKSPKPKTTGVPDRISLIRALVRRIPRGRVSTYGAIAAAAGIPRGARIAVRALQGAIDLPWHRVVAAGGRIALPGESGYDQRLRLEMEGVKFSGRKVRMSEFEHRFRTRATAAGKRITAGVKRPAAQA